MPPASIPQDQRVTAMVSLLAVAAVLEQAGFAVELVDPSAVGTANTVAQDGVWMARWGGMA
jgi:hypothetical protein